MRDDYKNFINENTPNSEEFYGNTPEKKELQLSKSSKQNNTDEQFIQEAIILINNNNDIKEKSYHCQNCQGFPSLKLGDDSKVSIQCPCGKSIESDLDGIIDYIIKNKDDELQKVFRCQKHENQPYISFCIKCKNLCEICLQSHKNQENMEEHKIFNFKEEDEKIKKENSYINKFFELYNIKKQTKTKKETEKNQNDSVAFWNVKKTDILKNIKVKQLYDNILYCKKQFPHYNHYLNIREIYYYLLDKLEIHYKSLNEMDKKINIFGKNFVENNKGNCYLIIKEKELKLTDQYQLEEQDKSELTIHLVQEKPIENMSEMFKECHCLSSVTFQQQWLMSKITDMSSMFLDCNNLKHFNGSYLDTSKVKNFSKMFYNCESLKDKDLNMNFNTESAENLKEMFYGCISLKEITSEEKTLKSISNWETKNVIDMSFMFSNCNNLQKIDLSRLDIPKVKYLTGMFKGCQSLESITFKEKINSSEVIKMDYMFAECQKLEDLNGLSSFNTGNVKFMKNMFQNCSSLKKLDLSKWNTEKVLYMICMFQNCSSLEKLDLSEWEMEKVLNKDSMILNYSNTDKKKCISKWNTKEVIFMNDMFQNCRNIKTFVDIFEWETKDVQSFNKMFDGCNQEIIKPPWYKENQ